MLMDPFRLLEIVHWCAGLELLDQHEGAKALLCTCYVIASVGMAMSARRRAWRRGIR